MVNTATLEEAKGMKDQGENIRRISWFIFIFLPLSLMAVSAHKISHISALAEVF